MGATREVDLVRRPPGEPLDLMEVPRRDALFRLRHEFGRHAQVGSEFRVRFDLRPEFRETVADGFRLLGTTRLPEDVPDDLLVFDRLYEPLVFDRLPRG